MIIQIKNLIKKNKTLYSCFKTVRFYKRNKMFLKFGRETLIDFDKACKEANVRYWLDFGTLLGAVREHDFIKHDFDIDTGMFLDEYSPKLKEILKQHGFNLKHVISIDNGVYGLEESYEKNGVTIDIFYYNKKDSTMSCHAFIPFYPYSTWKQSIKKFGGLQVIEHTFPITNNLLSYEFLGNKFYIPENYDEHLRAHYGNYMVKDKNFVFKNAPDAKVLNDKLGIVEEK